GVEDAGVQPDGGFAVVRRIPGEPQPRLPHRVVAGDLAVRGERLRAGRGGHGPADERREEHLIGGSARIGLDLRFPTEAGLDRQVWPRLPLVLKEDGRLALANLLPARLFDGPAADSGL